MGNGNGNGNGNQSGCSLSHPPPPYCPADDDDHPPPYMPMQEEQQPGLIRQRGTTRTADRGRHTGNIPDPLVMNMGTNNHHQHHMIIIAIPLFLGITLPLIPILMLIPYCFILILRSVLILLSTILTILFPHSPPSLVIPIPSRVVASAVHYVNPIRSLQQGGTVLLLQHYQLALSS